MTHRFLDWPPLRHAFATLDSRKRRQESKTEEAVDIVQAVSDGPDRALKFYNFVCSIEQGRAARRKPLKDSRMDREIISFYVRYHYLLSRNDTTASNALIGAWQKKLGHKNLWEDFNLEYENGPPPMSGIQRARPSPMRVPTRKSTGCIPERRPPKTPDLSSRRSSAEYHCFSDSPLTPLPSSDDEDDTPLIATSGSPMPPKSSGRNDVLRLAADLPARDSSDSSFGSMDKSISRNRLPWDINMDPVDEPPPTPPQDVDVFIDPLHHGPECSTTSLMGVASEGTDETMYDASAFTMCLRSGRRPGRPVTGFSGARSFSAPVPLPSSAPSKKGRRRVGNSAKKKPRKQKKPGYIEDPPDQQMAIDIPAIANSESGSALPSNEPIHQDTVPSEPFIPRLELSEHPPFRILIRPTGFIPPIVPDFRGTPSISYTTATLPRPSQALHPAPSSNNRKGLRGLPAVGIPRFTRPPLPSNPPIWAQSRQELCESCDFFKSYQAGVYYCNGYAKGYLLSCFGAMRDIWQDGGRLIISHGGGKAASKLLEADHQSFRDSSVNALVKNWQTKEPLVLVADDKYEHFPFDLTRGCDGGKGYAYVVLGYYFIRHYWAEKHPADNGEGYAVRFKFAFQYCGEGDPWWMKWLDFPQRTLLSPGTDGFQTICETACSSCGKSSPTIYEQGWMCLSPGCEFHFQLYGVDAVTTHLTYTTAFLAARPNPKAKKPAVRIPPPVLESANGTVTTPLFYHGWHCDRCGRLSCRTKWEHWECSSCGLILPVKGTIRDHKEFWGLSPNVQFANCDVNPVSGITKIVRLQDQLVTYKFVLPHNRGKIHLISGSVRYNVEADEIFREYQEHANNGSLPFRRFPMKAHICRGEFLTNYFSQNSGEPYQYVGAADKTLPFDQCPPCVLRALELVRTRASLVLGELPTFNELLTAAYMEKQSMGFHTDGERGLGPIVASLSMGSPAIMKFRTLEDRKTVVLSLVLRHGDVVVMEGATIQAVYEHTVCPIGFRIAVTAREINSENSTEGAWR